MIRAEYRGRNPVVRRRRAAEKKFSVFCLLAFLLLSPALLRADGAVEVRGLRHWSTPEYARVVIDLSAPADFSKGHLSDPERLFFDLKDARLAVDCPRSVAINDKFIKAVRMGQFDQTTVRIVFDLATSDYDYKVFSLNDPARLVIEVLAKTPDGGKTPADGGKEGVKGPDTQKPEPKRKDAGTESAVLHRTIVIDPGHGGHDTGAIGPDGLYEKDVVLDVALKVKDILEREYPEYKVVMTRDSDVFIPLSKRAEIANMLNADLFLSIHANASPDRNARGIETYLLNYTNDEEALRVAARENAISIKKMKQVQDDLGFIKASLARELKRDDSVRLAGYVQSALISTMKPGYPDVKNLGVKQALFYVLVDAKMASVLAEISFISNPEEEKLLSTDSYRQEIAYSLVHGINAYFTSSSRIREASGTPKEVISYNKYVSAGNRYKARPAKYVRRVR